MTDGFAAENDPASADRFRPLLEGSRHRWHAAPGEGSLFVLDDGTGDVELRFEAAGEVVRAVLTRRDVEVERFEIGRPTDEEAEAFRGRLEAAVAGSSVGQAGEGKGRTRFIASFEAAQLAGLREVAERDGVPVAEVVRRAVQRYLDSQDSQAGLSSG